jgi:tetratricopeptide (TPR) repeat protein
MYNISQRFTALFLLFSILLQSCYTPLKMHNKKQASSPIVHFNKSDNNSRINSPNYLETEQTDTDWLQLEDEEKETESQPQSTAHLSDHMSENYFLQQGQEVKFYQKQGTWNAHITEKCPHLQRSEHLPVICDLNIKVEDLTKMPNDQAKKHIHRLKKHNKEIIYIGNLGLLGGMDVKEVGVKQTEEEQISKTTHNWLQQGDAHFDLAKFEEAIECYNKALEHDLEGDYIYVLIQKSRCLAALNKNQEALDCLDLALTLKPQDPSAYYRRVGILHRLGQKEEALKALSEGPQITNDDYFAYFNKGLTLYELEQDEDAIQCYDAAININPNDADTYLNKGLALYKLEQYEGAIQCYDTAINLNPNDATAYYKKGRALDELGQKEEAIIFYNKALEINPNDEIIYFNKGLTLYELKQYEDAIQCYDTAINLNPNDTDTYLNKGLALYKMEQYEDAIQCYDTAINLNPNDAITHNNKGLALASLEQHKGAIQFYDTAIKLNPNDEDAFHNKGKALYELGQKEEAIIFYNKALEINPNDEIVYFNKGLTLYELEQYEAAIQCYDAAININPNDEDTYLNKCLALYKMEQYETAIQCYDAAININPNDADTYLNKGLALYKMEQYKAAIQCYDTAININRNDADTYLNKGLALYKMEQYKAAIQCYDTAININPNDADTYLNKGLALYKMEQYEAAIQCYDTAIKLNPNEADAFHSKGKTLDKLGQKEAAIIFYNKALKINPNYEIVYFNKGLTLYKLGQHEDAIQCYDAAIKLNPNDADAFLNKGKALDQLGHYEAAIQCYNTAINLNPNDADAYHDKGLSFASLYQLENAIQCYDTAIKLNPNDAKAYFNKGVILNSLYHREDALQCYDTAIKLNPNDTGAYLNKGLVLASLNQDKDALQCYDTAIKLNPNDAKIYLNKGLILASLNQQEAAIDCYDKALQLNPNLTEVYFNKGLILASLDKHAAAIDCYHKALRLNPNLTEAYFNKGLSLDSLGQEEKAIESYDKAIQLNTKNVSAYLKKGIALEYLGQQEDAIKCYDAAINLHPNDSDAYLNKGKVLASLGKHEDAIQCYDAAINLHHPNDADAYLNKGKALASLGKHEDAIQCYNKTIQLQPKHKEAYYNKGNALCEIGQHEKAILYYDFDIKLNPNNAKGYFIKGLTLYELSQYKAAIECHDEAIKLDPNYADAYFNKGCAFYELGQKEAAIGCYDKVLQLSSNAPNAYFNKGLTLWELGHKVEAIDCYNKALELNPKDILSYNNKGKVLYELGQKEAAIECYDAAIKLYPNYEIAYDNKGQALDELGHSEAASYYKAIGKGIQAYQVQQYGEAIEWFNKAIETTWPINIPKEAGEIPIFTTYYFKLLACSKLRIKDQARECIESCKRLGYFEELLISLSKGQIIKLVDLIYNDKQDFIDDLKLVKNEKSFNEIANLYIEKLEGKDKKFFNLLLKDLKKERHLQEVSKSDINSLRQTQDEKIHEGQLIKLIKGISKQDIIITAQNTIKQLLKDNPDYRAKLAEICNLQSIINQWLKPEVLIYKDANRTNPELPVKSLIDLSLADRNQLVNGDLTKESKVFATIHTRQAEIVQIKNKLEKMPFTKPGLQKVQQTVIDQLTNINNYYTNYIEELCTSHGEARKLHLQPKILLQSDGIYSYLEESVAEKIIGSLNKDGNLEKDVNQQLEGVHTVRKIGGMFFKYKPYRPGIEFMVSKLIEGNYLTAATRLVNIKKEGRTYPFLVSKEVEGQDLEHFLKKQAANFLQKLDPTNFAYIFALTLLTNPRDAKADNYFVTFDINPVNKGIDSYRIIGIDNDMSFVKGFSKYKDGKCDVNVRSLIYFFPQMRDTIDEKFRDEFLKLRPEVVIMKWLQKLDKQNRNYENMREQGVFNTIDYEGEEGKLDEWDEEDKGMQLPIKLKEGLVSELYFKLSLMHESITKNPNLTYQELFEKVQTKIVSTYYQEIQKKIKNKLLGANGLEEKAGHQEFLNLTTKGQEVLDCIYSLYENITKSTQTIKDKIDISLIKSGDKTEMSKLASLLVKTEKGEDDVWTQEINKSIDDFFNLIYKISQNEEEEPNKRCIYYAILDHVVEEGNKDLAEELVEKLHDLDKLASYIANKYGQEKVGLLMNDKDYSDIAKYLIENCAKPVNNNLETKSDTEEKKFAMYSLEQIVEQKGIMPYAYKTIDQDMQYIMVDNPYKRNDFLGLEVQELIETKEKQASFPLQYSSAISDIKEQEAKQAEINLAQKLIAQSAQGDDRTIASHGLHNHRYLYGMADAMRLTLAIRQNYLYYDNMPIKGGEQFSALRENHHHIFLADPYHIENFANALRDDVDLLITRWQQMPNTLLIPILGGMHWRIVQIKVDYEQKTIKICWDDPYGENHFPTHMRQSILSAVKQHISKLIQKQTNDLSFSLVQASIQQEDKKIDQQGSGINDWDCGPIIFSNLKDYIKAIKSGTEVDYSLGAYYSINHQAEILNTRQRDYETYCLVQEISINYRN